MTQSQGLRLFTGHGEHLRGNISANNLASRPDLARRLGPEPMHHLMQTLFAVLQQIMHHYAGALIEFSGDGFLALFGAPVALEDHAQRAVLAALTLHQRLGEHPALSGQSPESPFAVCMGLHSGRGVVGHLGHDAQRLYAAVGDPTELAMHLRHQAAPGAILLSAATAPWCRRTSTSRSAGR